MLAENYYLSHSGLFFEISGWRFYFDVSYVALACGVIGYKSRSTTRTAVVCLVSLSILISILFALCQPILCYDSGPDGLSWLRMGTFLASEGIALGYLGSQIGGGSAVGRWTKLLVEGCTFYAVAYIPLVFTMAGGSLLPQLDGLLLPSILAIIAALVVVTFGEEGKLEQPLIPLLSIGVLVLVGSGNALQYYAELQSTLVLVFLYTALGSTLGFLGVKRTSRVSARLRHSSFPFIGLVLLIIVGSLVVWPEAVVGTVISTSSLEAPIIYSYTIPDAAGGFMSSPMIHSEGVGVNVTFVSYNMNSISSGGFLAGGIGVHSADCCTDGIDYGYRFDAILFGNGTEVLAASAWKVCDSNAACGGPTWKHLMYFKSLPLSRPLFDAPVRLSLSWRNHSVVWTYSLAGAGHVLGTFAAPSRENANFNTGWQVPPYVPVAGGALFFQFGVSKSGLLVGQWSVRFDCPSILLNNTWGCIDHAESFQGDQSYWKALWRWGDSFPGVEAQVNSTSRSVTFFSSTSAMGSFATFW